MVLILYLSFIFNILCSSIQTDIFGSSRITPSGSLYSTDIAVTTTVYGRTMDVDPGSHQRIIDIAGKVDLITGNLPITVIFSSVFEAEAIDDGIASYDFNTNQISFVSNSAFGGAVFTADMTKNTVLPPSSFNLLPVAYLGYDPVTARRIIGGQNTPGNNFIILEKPNFGEATVYRVPTNILLTANDAYDGKTGNYYVINGTRSLVAWNVVKNVTSSFILSCLPPNGYISGSIFVNPADGNTILGIVSTGQVYSLVSINLSGKNCYLVGALPGLPPSPHVIIAQEVGYLSGYIAISVTSDAYNAIIIYDQTLKVVTQVRTISVIEDIFIQETNN